jgi:kynurenine formamidase
VDETDVVALFTFCSNAGRWGLDDELGTLNLITPKKRVQAAGLVRSGRNVSLGHDLSTTYSRANSEPMVHRMHLAAYAEPIGALDSVLISSHGFAVTHLDAVSHVNFRGAMYNRRNAASVMTPQGLTTGSILAMKDGIFTRGVIVDVAAARGVDWLELEETVTAKDLEEAERHSGVTVHSGDAIFVRVGFAAREAAVGEGDPLVRPGLTPDAVRWLYERDVAVYSGDCVEQMPGPYSAMPLPLHQIGIAAMGLAMLDNVDMERLVSVAAEEGRSEFLFVCSPLRIPGGTGSAVNPLAIF